MGAHPVELLRALDAFGKRGHAEFSGQADDGLDQGGRVRRPRGLVRARPQTGCCGRGRDLAALMARKDPPSEQTLVA